jgi:CRISPR-associated protein Csd1
VSWIQKLYETYEQCWGKEAAGEIGLLPIGHTPQQAHVEITIDVDGNFKSARTIQKVETVIPATEKSAGRTANCAPHPLCDKVQYCAIDYPKYGGRKPSFFEAYEEQLNAWCESEFSHPKARAVLKYVRNGRLILDLVSEKVLHLGTDGTLLTRWVNEGQAPDIFRFLTAKEGARDQGDAFIRWQVWEPGNPCSAVWEDQSLQNAWTGYDASTKKLKGVCMVTGNEQAALAMSHPKRIRHAGDGAKLISANDSSGYTFRGRFTDDTGLQACGVGYEVTQKAHNALRWLIQRQAYRNEDQVIVTWLGNLSPTLSRTHAHFFWIAKKSLNRRWTANHLASAMLAKLLHEDSKGLLLGIVQSSIPLTTSSSWDLIRRHQGAWQFPFTVN